MQTSALLLLLLATAAARPLKHRYVSVDIGDSECNVDKYGAKGDGKTDDTHAIQSAINDCGARGGGRVTLGDSGKTYLVFSLALNSSNTEFHVSTGATLRASDDMAAWKGKGSAIIVAESVQHVAITGGGTVDGQGLLWWREMKKPGKDGIFRPHTVDFKDVKHGVIADTLFMHGPNHILELGCDNCELDSVRVLNPPSTGDCESDNSCSHNTDAVDIHGEPFYVHDVNFTTGDDNIAAHANHTLVEDSYFGSGHGASIGSLCGDWLTNITFRNISFHGTTTACRIKSHAGCGGHVWDVHFKDLTTHGVPSVIDLNQFYGNPSKKKGTYRFDQIYFQSITSYGTGNDPAGRRRRRRRKVPALGSSNQAIAFDCDTGFNGVNNCDVTLQDVKFIDNKGATMLCQGVKGTTKDVDGIQSCLKAAQAEGGL